MTTYKVLNGHMRSMYGGSAKWTPGRKKSVRGHLVPCSNGLHICRDEVDLIQWLGPVICECEHSSEYADVDDKRACRWVRIGEPNPHWNKRTMRHFVCDCAEYALQYAPEQDHELSRAVIDTVRASADFGDEWDAAVRTAHASAQAAYEMACTTAQAAYAASRAAAGTMAYASARASAHTSASAVYAAHAREHAAAIAIAHMSAHVARASARAAISAATSAAYAASCAGASASEHASAYAAASSDLAAILKTYLDGTNEWVIASR